MSRIIKPLRPPVYEFSVKNIYALIYGGILLTCSLIYWCKASQSIKPLFILLSLQILFAIGFKCIWFNAKVKDVPAECYHADLLPQEEYLIIKRQYQNAKDGISRINSFQMEEEDKMTLLNSYQEIIDNLSPIFKSQNDLRTLCLLKKVFGYIETPAIYKTDSEEEEFEFGDNEDIETEFEASNDVDVVDEDIFQPFGCQIPQPFEISLSEYENESQNNESNDSNLKPNTIEEVVKQLESLKIQFAEMKAENTTLKESIEQILESQIVL